jgi:flagellar basal-body rod protein FlgG
LDVIAHTLANANTTAFKRLRIRFQEVLPQPGQELNTPSMTDAFLVGGLQTGLGVRATCTTRNFSMGELLQTGEQLDVAIKGDGFFEVVLPDGTKAYTRDGALRTGADRRLTTADGFPLGSGFQPIEPGTTSITLSPEGMITCLNQKGAKSFQLHICRFANPAGMQSIGRNLYGETMVSGMVEHGSPGQKGFGELVQGFLERSNVDVVEEVQDLIRLQTAFDAYATVTEMTRKLRTPLSTTAQSTTAISR